MRKLATLRTIAAVNEHSNADRLAIYTVDGWKVIDQKDKYTVGDKVIYCEIDSLLPIKPEFEFLRKSSYKKIGEQEGFRLRTVRLRGELSQGLLLSPDVLPVGFEQKESGEDVSEVLGIVKYDPPIPACLAGKVKGHFPSFIPKTDEERIQNLPFDELVNHTYTVTEKLDGSSMTAFVNEGEIGVCSRNLEVREDEKNSMWRIVNRYGLKEKLVALDRNLAIQGELIGPGVQGNLYKLPEIDLRLFKAWDITSHQYLDIGELKNLAESLGLETVPVLESGFVLPETVEEALEFADAKSTVSSAANREGVVLYSESDPDTHFKIISNQFLEKEK